MGMNLDAIGETFDWNIKGNIFGHPFEWVGKLKVVSTQRRAELQALISQYAQLLRNNPTDPDLKAMSPLAVAQELLKGWHDPNGEIVYKGEVLTDTPENIELVLNQFPGVAEAVCLQWFEAANGERARLGNSESSHGFGAMAKQVGNGRGRP